MHYFIPSWYDDDIPWNIAGHPWYVPGSNMKFDSTVNDFRMFQEEDPKEVSLLIFGYAPQLRQFLHRQNLGCPSVHSVFDRFQDIHETELHPVSYRSLEWRTRTEWLYFPFQVMAYQDGVHYANVEFTEDGTVFCVDFLEKERTTRRDLYDDRGFLSSQVTYQNGMPGKQVFYDDSGNPQFERELPDGTVHILEAGSPRFRRSMYPNIASMLMEYLGKWFRSLGEKDDLVLASAPLHNRLVSTSVGSRRLIFDVPQSEFPTGREEYFAQMLRQSMFVVTDTIAAEKKLKKYYDKDTAAVLRRLPIDLRPSQGESVRMRQMKIFFPAEGLQEPMRTNALVQLLSVLDQDPDTRLVIGVTEERSRQVVRQWLSEVLPPLFGDRLRVEGMDFDAADKGADDRSYEEAETDDPDIVLAQEPEEKLPQISIAVCLSEEHVVQILREIRLIVDVRKRPNEYLQIAGISMGIPQIVADEQHYIENRKNGLVIREADEIPAACRYYLDSLMHWNESYVYCMQHVQQYENGSVLRKWKQLLESEEG